MLTSHVNLPSQKRLSTSPLVLLLQMLVVLSQGERGLCDFLMLSFSFIPDVKE